MILKFNRVRAVSQYMFVQNFIHLRADITLEILRGTFVIMSPSPNIGGDVSPLSHCPIWIDTLVSDRANRQIKTPVKNTVRRYRADSKNKIANSGAFTSVNVGAVLVQHVNVQLVLGVRRVLVTAARRQLKEQVLDGVDEVLKLGVVEPAQLENLDGVRRVVEDHRRFRLVYQILETFEVAQSS